MINYNDDGKIIGEDYFAEPKLFGGRELLLTEEKEFFGNEEYNKSLLVFDPEQLSTLYNFTSLYIPARKTTIGRNGRKHREIGDWHVDKNGKLKFHRFGKHDIYRVRVGYRVPKEEAL